MNRFVDILKKSKGVFYMRKRFILYLLLCCPVWNLSAQKPSADIVHTVLFLDFQTGNPLSMTTVMIEELELMSYTDIEGKIFLRRLVPGKFYTLQANYIGYMPVKHRIMGRTHTHTDTVYMEPKSYALKGVTVTAELLRKESGITRIRKDALEYLQPTGLLDVMALTPGGLWRNPGLRSVQQIEMRETRTSQNSALGTSVIMDEVPMSNDANLQGMGNRNQKLMERSTMNMGIDMREISIDHIESIEVIQGIPSVRYGNLTSGAIVLNTKAGVSPYEVRIQADPYTKLFSVGKGFDMSKGQSLYAGMDYAGSTGDIRNPITGYRRITGLLRYAYTGKGEWTPKLNITLNYTTTLDSQKFDPETMVSKETYRGEYDKIGMITRFAFNYGKKAKYPVSLEATFSLNLIRDVVRQERYITPNKTLAQPLLKTDGEAEGIYLPNIYFSEFSTDGRPMAAFVQIRNTYRFYRDKINGSLMAGFEFRYDKNFGKGPIYDPKLPPNPDSPTSSRPLAYKDIPASAPLACFIEQNLRFELPGGWKNHTRVGVRLSHDLAIMGQERDLAKTLPAEPRMYTSFSAPDTELGGSPLRTTLSFGYGRHIKFPTLAYLHPEPAYLDFIEANYYHNKPENRLLWVRTYVFERINPQLKCNMETKWEVGIDLGYGGARLQLNFFRHFTKQGFENRDISVYTPFNRYTYDGNISDTKPTLDLFEKERIERLSLLSMPDNSVKTKKKGVEYILIFPEILPLNTKIRLQGAYYKTLYGNSLPVAYRPSVILNNMLFPYIGFYEGRNDNESRRFHSVLRTDTHIPALRLIFSTALQSVWFTDYRVLPYAALPAYWVAPPGEKKTGMELDISDPLQKQLVLPLPDGMFKATKTPVSLSCNMKMTKELGRHVKVSFFVNEIFSYNPVYETNLKVRLQNRRSAFFGSEIKIRI